MWDELSILDESIPIDEMIHTPQEVARRYKKTCGLRRCGEEGLHKYHTFAKCALNGEGGFEKVEPNDLIHEWGKFEFVRNTGNRLKPIRISKLVDLTKKAEGLQSPLPTQLTITQFTRKTLTPSDRWGSMEIDALDGPYASYEARNGIKIGEDPDDDEILKVGLRFMWLTHLTIQKEGVSLG